MSNYIEYGKDLEDYVVDLRRYFHKNPEASLKEYNTSKRIIKELEKLNIPYKLVGDTGVIGFIGKDISGKKIALRADIDALEIEDKKNEEYKSKNKGLMHACGHDGHTASLIGACRVLKEIEEDIDGQVLAIFQQAEEIGQGARVFADEGYLDNISSALGIHYASNLNTGEVAVRKGSVAAACDYFSAKFIGKSGHVSKPNLSVDALYTASNAIVNLQSIVARHVDPLDPVLVGIGVLNSGTRYNIIAGEAVLEGTFRTFNEETRNKVRKEIKEIFEFTAKYNGAEVEIDFKSFADPLINDDNEVEKIIKVAEKIVGSKNIVLDREKALGSDDFAVFSKYAPSVYIHVGSGNIDKPNTRSAHHNEYFDLDEDSLIIGTKLYVQYILNEFNI